MFVETANQQPTVLTVGHSTHAIRAFIELLLRHQVSAICDVRSTPFSRLNPQFNRDELKTSLRGSGIAYAFLGRELGARSQDPTCYVEGRVQYERLAKTDLFRMGLQRIFEGMKTFRIAVMCAERDPLQCHRAILISRYIEAAGVRVEHISNGGELESHSEALQRLIRQLRLKQNGLFRSSDDLIEDAYRIQGERIAYQQEPPERKSSLEGHSR